ELSHQDNTLSPPPVARRGTATEIARGGEIFLRQCAKCHANIDGRGAGIPDLKRMSATTHAEFNDILLRGSRVDRGMGNFSDLLTPAEVESVHSYLIDQAWQAFEQESQTANNSL
ncbi:MAG: cytochrome c, partial [Gammaproteobacteria bacterium]|nr:cytochrome c [Gammaproteobacteria bacterium]